MQLVKDIVGSGVISPAFGSSARIVTREPGDYARRLPVIRVVTNSFIILRDTVDPGTENSNLVFTATTLDPLIIGMESALRDVDSPASGLKSCFTWSRNDAGICPSAALSGRWRCCARIVVQRGDNNQVTLLIGITLLALPAGRLSPRSPRRWRRLLRAFRQIVHPNDARLKDIHNESSPEVNRFGCSLE